MQLLDRLLAHDQWATSQLLAAARPLSDDQLNQEFDIGHRTLRATLEHMIMNVEGWTAAFTGQESISTDASIAGFAERHIRVYPAFTAAAQAFASAERLDETFTDSFGEPQTFGAAFLMVILHNEGHRTEVLHILRRLGLDDVPEVDYGLWDFVRRGLAT
ncbi:MAG: DinB family protein [Thermomicrobiales bacterium]